MHVVCRHTKQSINKKVQPALGKRAISFRQPDFHAFTALPTHGLCTISKQGFSGNFWAT